MSDTKPDKEPEAKSQVEKFRELARKIGADGSEEPLNEALRKVARVKRVKVGSKKK